MSVIDRRITRARSSLIMDHPFYGSLAMRLDVMESAAFPTMATDGFRLWYNKGWLDTIDEDVLMFVVIHEILHCVLGHHIRRGGRDHKRWNIACDYVVNLILLHAGYKVPDWVYLDERFDGLNAEQVYRVLEDEEAKAKPPEPQQGPEPQTSSSDDAGDEQEEQQQDEANGGDDPADGDDGDGGQPGDDGEADGDPMQDGLGEGDAATPDAGNGGTASGGSPSAVGEDVPVSHGDFGGCGEILDAAPSHDEAALAEAAAEWEVATRQAVNVAKRQEEGKLPGFLKEIVDQLNDPRTDWREVVRRFVDPSSTKDFSWSMPSRRHLPFKHYTPGMVTDGVSHVAMMIDTSGSIDTELLKVFGGEVQAALDDGAIDKITLVFCDTRVNRTAEYSKGDIVDFTCQGRGGTEFFPAIKWVEENAQDVVCAIYFTDLDCSDYGEEPPFPMLWAAYGSPWFLKDAMKRVPFGEIIEVAN